MNYDQDKALLDGMSQEDTVVVFNSPQYIGGHQYPKNQQHNHMIETNSQHHMVPLIKWTRKRRHGKVRIMKTSVKK
jgi:hypothetical protein